MMSLSDFLLDKSIPPYKYKGSRPIKNHPIDQNTIQLLLLSSLPFLQTLAFPTLICYSSFVSAMFECVLSGLPILEQPYVRLP